jgi:DNA-binding SARP family transcriptional activator
MTSARSGGHPATRTRALLSTVALLLISVAVPIVLATAGGSPIPRGGLGRLRTLLHHGQGFDASLVTGWVLHGALFLAWVTWAWMLICVLIELVSWVTGRTPTRLPGSRTLQAAAACLVGTSLAMLTMGRTLPMPVVHATPPTVSSSAVETAAMVGTQRPASRYQPRQEGVEGLRVVEDYHFGSAEDAVGADGAPDEFAFGLSPPEDSGRDVPFLNAGLDGLRLPVSIDSDLNHVPSDPALGRAEGESEVHTVSGRETLWSIAHDRLGDARRWREIAELNYSVRQPDGRMLAGDHWVAPGWNLRLPPTASPTASASLTPSTSTERPSVRLAAEYLSTSVELPSPHRQSGRGRTPSETSAGRLVVDGSEAAGTHDHPDPLIASTGDGIPLELLGAGLLGAGVVGLLERLRRAQQRHRKEGEFIAMPGGGGRAAEHRLRRGDSQCDMRALEKAVSSHLQSSARGGQSPPAVIGIQLHPDRLELRVKDDHETGQLEASGSSQITSVFLDLPTEQDVESHPDTSANRAPCPTLVTVGFSSAGPLLLNLESIGSLALVGQETACEGVVRVLALELATSPYASQFDLVLMGFGDELTRFVRVSTAVDREALIDQLHRRRLMGAATPPWVPPFSGRSPTRSGAIDPMVVICGPALAPEDVADLVTAGSDPSTRTAVIACGEGFWSEYRLPITAGDGASVLDPLGAVIFPNRISTTDLQGVCALVDAALDRRSVSSGELPYEALTIPLPDYRHLSDADTPRTNGGVPAVPGLASADAIAFEQSVRVCVLGPVEIRGAARPFTRAWSKELVVYLAMHPHGVSNDAWATALWPDRLMASSSLHSTASVARRSLGQGHDGRDHLPRAHGRLALAESVGTDWAEFVRMAETDDLDNMRKAMELVRGRPFEGLRASDWPILEGVAPAIEAATVDVAGRLAGRYLQQGDAAGAEWSARKGLLVSPYDERLYRMLLRAADSAGNPAGVESVMSELIRLVADDVEPFDSVHPSTMELYRSLTRRKALVTSPR